MRLWLECIIYHVSIYVAIIIIINKSAAIYKETRLKNLVNLYRQIVFCQFDKLFWRHLGFAVQREDESKCLEKAMESDWIIWKSCPANESDEAILYNNNSKKWHLKLNPRESRRIIKSSSWVVRCCEDISVSIRLNRTTFTDGGRFLDAKVIDDWLLVYHHSGEKWWMWDPEADKRDNFFYSDGRYISSLIQAPPFIRVRKYYRRKEPKNDDKESIGRLPIASQLGQQQAQGTESPADEVQ